MTFRVAVLASGTGSNLQALIDKVHGHDGVEIVGVVSNKPDAQALGRAREAGMETEVFSADDHPDRASRDDALANWLDEREVHLIVLAGFMEILSRAFIERFRHRIVNVHPSLLPAFPGVRSIEKALDYGVHVTGVTVHFVDEGVDSGPIIMQKAFELPYHRDVEGVEARIHEIEHELLPQVVRLIAAGAVEVEGRQVRVRDGEG
ncbi:MAG: phosphoribosylglycinamide formyltransferase [Thermoleophilaceae bacterium]